MIDWNQRPYVTGIDLMEMPAWQRQWFYDQPNIWRRVDLNRDALFNMAHPSNALLCVRMLAKDAGLI